VTNFNVISTGSVFQIGQIIFSDGNANKGPVGEQIGINVVNSCEGEEIFVSCYGIGSSYNEKLLTSIARMGKGDYFYIDQKNLENTPYLVQSGINNLTKFWTVDAQMFAQGYDGTVVTEFKGSTDLFKRSTTSIKPLTVKQYLIKATNTTHRIGNVKFILTYTNMHTNEKIRLTKNCGWEIVPVDLDQLDLVVTDRYRAYDAISRCSKINEEIFDMIEIKAPAERVIQKKEEIAKIYEEALPYDEFFLIPALIDTEMKAIENFRKFGVYDQRSIKTFNYQAAKVGKKSKNVYAYAEEEDGDSSSEEMGFGGLF